MKKMLLTFGTRAFSQRLANQFEHDFELLMATSEEVPRFLTSKFLPIPTGANPTFSHELLKFCLDHQIQYVLPLGLEEIKALSATKLLFEEYGIAVLCPELDQLTDILIMENPSNNVQADVYLAGKSLTSNNSLIVNISGLFATSDDEGELALCTI